MRNHQPFTLYGADGAAVRARYVYSYPTTELADYLVYLISDDGRVIHCQDEQQGVFWYEDTRENLYRDNPA